MATWFGQRQSRFQESTGYHFHNALDFLLILSREIFVFAFILVLYVFQHAG
jgi:hypothetical protein